MPPTIDVPRAWEQRLSADLRGIIMVVGAVDTGKSTLIRYLWARLAGHTSLALIDADIGQSVLGPPTTQTLRLASPEAPHEFPPRGRMARWFVGAVSPRGHMLPTVIGLFRLVAQARRWRAQTVLVDTTGLVAPHVGGVALKWAKFDLVNPDVVIALQRAQELEPLIGPWRGSGRFRLVELPVSPLVRVRTREERVAWRQYRFRVYFRRAREVSLSTQRIALLGRGDPLPDRLVGFLDRRGFLLALGIVRRWEEDRLQVLTPLQRLESVDAIRLGSVYLDETFRDRRYPRLERPQQPGGEMTDGEQTR